MRRNNNYILRTIDNTPYLLPIGQSIADFAKGIRLNNTGVYLWRLLRSDYTLEELVTQCTAYYSLTGDSYPALFTDIQTFINELLAKGLLISDADIEHINEPYYGCLEIAGIKSSLYGQSEAFSHEFDSFLRYSTEPAPDQYIIIKEFNPACRENGYCLLHNDSLIVMECSDKYVLLFPGMNYIEELHISKDGSIAQFYCQLSFDDTFRENLFHAIRHSFLFYAQLHGISAVHSSSVLYQNRLWLFSAPSGVGKSTHAALWEGVTGTSIINGDLNLITVEDDIPVVYGIPWCGTSGIFSTETYTLGGIVFLTQSSGNSIEYLSDEQKQLLLCQRIISPIWTERQFDANFHLVRELVRRIFICRLHCTPEEESVNIMKAAIDKYLCI